MTAPSIEMSTPPKSIAEPIPFKSPTDPLPWAVQVENVSKAYDIYLNDRARLLEFFGNRTHHQQHWALQNIDFEVSEGQSFGIIGANGAGKSTLLKCLAGITQPSTGVIKTRGELATLLDLGLGFHQHFSGRENIHMSCALLGLSPEETEALVPNIIQFAEIGDYIDYPVRTYSAGMNLRLGFAIAAHSPADVFLIDEVLAVGDQRFQRRCIHKIEEFLKAGRTLILVSHDLHAIRSLCTHALWLDQGQIKIEGESKYVVDQYLDMDRSIQHNPVRQQQRPNITPAPDVELPFDTDITDNELLNRLRQSLHLPNPASHFCPQETTAYDTVDGDRPVVQGTGEVRIIRVQLLDGDAEPRARFKTGDDLIVAVTFRTTEPVPRPIFGVALFRNDGTYIHGPNTRFDDVLDRDFHGVYTFFIQWRQIQLLSGTYRLSIAVFDQHHLKPHIWHNQLYDLEIVSDLHDHGMIMLDHAWGLLSHHEE